MKAPLLILNYHRIDDDPVDPNRLCVSPAVFDQQLGWMSQHAELVPLSTILAASRSPTPRSARKPQIALTFDDGYADNLTRAQPLLARHRAPATLFITTDFMDDSATPWWEILARALFGPGAVRSTTLRVGRQTVQLPALSAATADERRWTVMAPPDARATRSI